MPRFPIAHIRVQGVDLVIIPLDGSIRSKTLDEQNDERDEFQARSEAAGLAGTVVLVWDNNGRMGFLAPTNFHPYFKSINLSIVQRSVNKELSW